MPADTSYAFAGTTNRLRGGSRAEGRTFKETSEMHFDGSMLTDDIDHYEKTATHNGTSYFRVGHITCGPSRN